jgi:hypothetical protein
MRSAVLNYEQISQNHYDSVRRYLLYNSVIYLDVPVKLVRLIRS